MSKKRSFKVGDVVTIPPKGSCPTRGRAVVVKITKKTITVLPIPDHCKSATIKFKPDQLRYWLKGNRNRRTHG